MADVGAPIQEPWAPDKQRGGLIGPQYEITPAGTAIAVDCKNGTNQRVQLTTTASVVTMYNAKDGQVVYLRVKQAAAGSLTIGTWTDVYFAGGTEPTITATANALDWIKLTYQSDLGKWYGEVLGQDFKA